ncbi:hypothetical protein LC608_33700 [Nostoc sp. XA010]|uniref:hypothetical protein n=1 Tax=Nostoc sp. XA010 TaxID=2780407 RepID=UPI001E38BA9F|nr:hypothetical protein [Nostoc sp. XA010]MCC5661815.1 hypothetical protein [Nostoc sp. XA010]
MFVKDCGSRLERNSRLIAQYNSQVEFLKANAQELVDENQQIKQMISNLEAFFSQPDENN